MRVFKTVGELLCADEVAEDIEKLNHNLANLNERSHDLAARVDLEREEVTEFGRNLDGLRKL